ncbi:MAG: hypothetical protein ACQEXJ_21940 [Myxococcota bacterium]
MRFPTPTRVLPSLLAAALLAVSTPGCASTSESREDDGALLLATPQYELHVVEGKVYQVVPDEQGTVEVREVSSYDKFRDLYRVERMRDLPATAPERGVVLNGWVGLECVRKGHACGRMPERGVEQNMIELRVRFPDRR